MRIVTVVAGCLLAASLAAAAPNVTAVKLDRPPTLDGQLTEAVWQGPAPVRDLVILNRPDPARHQTEAWVAYDADHLYLAVKAHDDEMARLRATEAERDGSIFADDVIELFLDVARDRFHLVQLAFNPLGTEFDGSGDAAGTSPDWNGQWSANTARGADFWSAEVAIPFATLGLSPGIGHTWGLNVCRERPADGELSCWSQTGARFAVPSAFGALQVDADFRPFAFDLLVADWGQGMLGSNAVRATVGNPGPQPRDVALSLAVTSADGRSRTCEASLPTLAPAAKRTTDLTYELSEEGRQYLMLAARERPGGRLIATVGRSLTVAPRADFSVFKSFYRDSVALRYRLNVPAAETRQYRLVVSLHQAAQARTLAERHLTPAASGEVRFGTAALAVGQYELRAVLRGPKGEIALEKTLQFPQLRDPVVKSRLVTVREDNMLIVQGKPFFPIGLYEAPSSEGYARALAEAGFNLCRDVSASRSAIAKAMSYGLHTWISVGDTLNFATDAAKKREALSTLVAQVGSQPGLLCWESMDEPAWGSASADGLYDGYCYLRALDQQRPIWTNHAPRNPVSTLAYYNRATDIAGCDIYPVPPGVGHSDLPDKGISVVGAETVKSRQSANSGKPVFMVIQGFGWAELPRGESTAAQPKPVMPTFAQSRFMAYDAIVHGAQGLLYWGTHYTRKPSRFWSELRGLVSELAALQEVLAARAYVGPEQAQLAGQSPGVLLLHKRLERRNFVIIVNETDREARPTLRLPGLRALRLRRLFENASVPLERGEVRLALKPYGVAVLSDDLTFADRRKDFSAEWRDRPTGDALPAMAEPGNGVRNAGFEVDVEGDLIPDLWEASVPFSAALTDREKHGGRVSLALSSDTADGGALAVQHNVTVKGDHRYRLTVWTKTSNADVEAQVYCEWSLGGRFNTHSSPWTKGTGQWQQLAVDFPATPDPQGGAYAVVRMRGQGTVWFDDVMLQEIR